MGSQWSQPSWNRLSLIPRWAVRIASGDRESRLMTDNLLKMMKRNPATIGLAWKFPLPWERLLPPEAFLRSPYSTRRWANLSRICAFLSAWESNTFASILFSPAVSASFATGGPLGLEWVESSSFPPVFQVFCCRTQKDVFLFFFSPSPVERKRPMFAWLPPAELRVSLMTSLSVKRCAKCQWWAIKKRL